MELVPGRGGRGEIVLGNERIDVLRLEQALYVRGNRTFLGSLLGQRAAAQLGDGWLRFAAYSGPLAPLGELTNLDGMMNLALSSHGALRAPRLERLGNRRVLAISDPAGGGTLYAAAVGVPYPVEIVRRGRSSGTLRFEAWNRPVTVMAPARSVHPEEAASREALDIGPATDARARGGARRLRGEGRSDA